MTPNPNDADVLRRYLLGSVDEESREAVERRLFSDDEIFWDRLSLSEEELIDDYVRGELDSEAAAGFERHFLCTAERRDKVEFARALKDHLGRPRPIAQGFWRRLRVPVAAPAWAMAAAAMLLLVLPGVAWQFATWQTQRFEIGVWLSPGALRDVGGGLERVTVPPDCRLVRLQLDPGAGGQESYRATLHKVSGQEIWSQNGLVATTVDGRSAVTLTLPAELLPTDDYYVRLLDGSPGGEQAFLDRYDFGIIRP